MSEAIALSHEHGLAGWPLWASVVAYVVGLGAMSAVAATSHSAPPPVPILLVTVERPAPPLEVPKPKVVKAPIAKPTLHQPAAAPMPTSAEPAALLDDAPRTEKPAAPPDPIAPDRRFLASAAAPGLSSTSDGVSAGTGALFSTADLPGAGRGASGGSATTPSAPCCSISRWSINQVAKAIPEHRAVIALTSRYHNLLRGWAES